MPILSMSVNVDGPLKACAELRQTQIPFTIARALTMAAVKGQELARSLEGSVFKMRNDWTVRNTKVRMATTSNLTATLFTDTENRSTGAPDYLVRQQDDFIRLPTGGGNKLAIPTPYLRAATGNGVIPGWLRPRQMLQFSDLGPPTRAGYRRMPRAVQNGYYFWAHPNKQNMRAIMGRQINERDAHVFYVIVSEAALPHNFPMTNDVADMIERELPAIFSQAAVEVIGNDLLRGSGMRVKL